MKINLTEIKRQTIEEFADEHDLIMEVEERHAHEAHDKYYASFKGAEIKEGGILIGGIGDGDTVKSAIADYAHKIGLTILVIDAYSKDRRIIEVPVLTDAERHPIK